VRFPWSVEIPGGRAGAFVALVSRSPVTFEAWPAGLAKAWTSDSAQTHVWAQSAFSVASPTNGGVVSSVGRWRLANGDWPDVLDQNRVLAGELTFARPSEIVRRSRGVFSVLSADAAGNVQAFADPLGFAVLFRASTSQAEVVASHAGLAAWAVGQLTGVAPRPDERSLAWLVFGSPRYDMGTGYAGVSQVESGAIVRIDSHGTASTEMAWTPPWDANASLENLENPALHARWLVEEIVSSIAAAVNVAAPEPLAVDLTGGRDSRMILAAILAGGLADQCEFHTAGPPHLPDMQLAHMIAERYGLAHRHVLPTRTRLDAVGEIEQTVWLTEAMASAIRPVPLEETMRAIRVGGTFDGLRAKFSQEGITLQQARARLASVAVSNHLGLIDEGRAVECCDEATTSVLGADPVDDANFLNDRLDAMWLRFGLRQHIGAMQPFVGLLRVLPLYSVDAIELAFREGASTARVSNAFNRSVYSLVPGLDDLPFSEEFAASQINAQAPAADQPTRLGRDKVPTVARVHRANNADERLLAFRQIAEQAPHHAWNTIDKERFDQAVQDRPASPKLERELFGAVSALTWLTGLSTATCAN
jgi:hypothetical protein